MRALVQRVSEASVRVDGELVGRIGRGLLVFLGIKNGDSGTDARLLAQKVCRLRIFQDDAGKMNSSLIDVLGQLLIVSQFTLYGETAKGNRPSFSAAAPAGQAEPLYGNFVAFCKELGVAVETGKFQADMKVTLINDGPVTLLCSTDS